MNNMVKSRGSKRLFPESKSMEEFELMEWWSQAKDMAAPRNYWIEGAKGVSK